VSHDRPYNSGNVRTERLVDPAETIPGDDRNDATIHALPSNIYLRRLSNLPPVSIKREGFYIIDCCRAFGSGIRKKETVIRGQRSCFSPVKSIMHGHWAIRRCKQMSTPISPCRPIPRRWKSKIRRHGNRKKKKKQRLTIRWRIGMPEKSEMVVSRRGRAI